MTNFKIFKKGEYLFKEGDKLQNVLIIQSGGVSACIIRPKKNMELFQLSTSQVIGETALLGATTHPFSAIATAETKVLEIPVEVYKQQLEAAPQMLKVIIKSLTDRSKNNLADLKSMKAEKDSSPCPDDQVAKAFASVYYTISNKGQKEKYKVENKEYEKISIDWNMLRQYAQRVFSEPPRRLEQVVSILVKLKIAKHVMGKLPEDPEGPDQIIGLDVFDLNSLENMFEFWQYHYFKGGRTELLKIDDNVMQILMILVKLGEKVELDRHGSAQFEYSKVVEYFKEEFGITLIPDHFTRLENKGLFCKRAANSQNVVQLAFDFREYLTTLKVWKFIREIDRLNEKGFVDMAEPELGFPKKKVAAGVASCPSCQAPLTDGQKFCGECGTKLVP